MFDGGGSVDRVDSPGFLLASSCRTDLMWRGVSVLNRKASEMNAQVCPAYRARNCTGVAVSHATRKEELWRRRWLINLRKPSRSQV